MTKTLLLREDAGQFVAMTTLVDGRWAIAVVDDMSDGKIRQAHYALNPGELRELIEKLEAFAAEWGEA